MIQNRKSPPYIIMGVLLLVLLIVAYLLSGLALVYGLTVDNFMEETENIFLNPLQNYWNEQSPIFLGVAFIVWLMLMANMNFRNLHLGREHGEEQWADVKQVDRQLRDKNPAKNRVLTENIHVSLDNVLSNNNMIVVGASGFFKTTSVLVNNLLNTTTSKVVLDLKGDTVHKYGNYLKKEGVKVNVINLVEPWKSDRYNPFVYVEREDDLVRLIENLQKSVKPPEAMKGDPFWDDGVALYLSAIFNYEWLSAKEARSVGSMNNILELVNAESMVIDDEGTTKLKQMMDDLAIQKGHDYPPVRDYRKLKEGASETVRSIILIVNAMFKYCETADMKRIFSGNDINIREIGLGVRGTVEKPTQRTTVLFLVMPQNNTTYNFFVSMVYNQLIDILYRTANLELYGPLPNAVEFYMDEFYSGPKPTDVDQIMSTCRSVNMSIILFFQSIAQPKSLYPNDKWEVLFDNASVTMFLGSGPSAKGTHEWVSGLLGEATIDTLSDGETKGRQGSSNRNYSKGGASLMKPAAVKRMPRTDCIIFMEEQFPIYDRKALPWECNKKLFDYANTMGAYVHNVIGVYNEEKREYRTIVDNPAFIELKSEADIEFYKTANNPHVRHIEVTEQHLAYCDWLLEDDELSDEEVVALFQKYHKNDEGSFVLSAEPDMTHAAHGEDEAEIPEDETLPSVSELKGRVTDCIKVYAHLLSDDQLEEIILGLEQGLSEEQVKSYFCLDVKRMSHYRRAYLSENRMSG